MKAICPKCRVEIPVSDINVSTDVALCRRCEQTFSYGDLIEEQSAGAVDLRNPPKGTWFREDMTGFEVGSTTRSGQAFFLVPFMCVWSGMSLGGIYGSQIAQGKFSLLPSLFGIPFLLGTILLGSAALMAICGKITVTVSGDDGVAFRGVGRIGFRRRFRWSHVRTVRMTEAMSRRGFSPEQITLDGPKRVDVGNGLKSERCHFMLAALRQMHRQRR